MFIIPPDVKVERNPVVMEQLYAYAIQQQWDPFFAFIEHKDNSKFILGTVSYYPEEWLPHWNLLDIALLHGDTDILQRFQKNYDQFGMKVRTTNDALIVKIFQEKPLIYIYWLLENQCISLEHTTTKGGYKVRDMLQMRTLKPTQKTLNDPSPFSYSAAKLNESSESKSKASLDLNPSEPNLYNPLVNTQKFGELLLSSPNLFFNTLKPYQPQPKPQLQPKPKTDTDTDRKVNFSAK